MSSSIPLRTAETIPTASMNPVPLQTQDVKSATSTTSENPKPQDTDVKEKESLSALEKIITTESTSNGSPLLFASMNRLDSSENGEGQEENLTTLSLSKKSRYRRRKILGPLPDLRFEQSYLNSISSAETVGSVIVITIRDQVILPLLQGTLWSLALLGWAHWNHMAQVSGTSMGTKLKRWWHKTNNWTLPKNKKDICGSAELGASVGDVSTSWKVGENWSFTD